MRTYVVKTARGPVLFRADDPSPRVMLFHGFKRTPGHLMSWRNRIPGLGLAALPGHGGAAELDDVSVAAWIEAWREAMNILGPRLLVGESLGAIVAMCLPAKAVVAVEPLLTVEHLWPQREVIRNARARGVEISAAHEALFNHSYEWVLDRISAPTLVIAGMTPLLPQRPLQSFAPSLLTDQDFDRYAQHPLVKAYRIPGGHTLLDENPDAVVTLASPFLAAHQD